RDLLGTNGSSSSLALQPSRPPRVAAFLGRRIEGRWRSSAAFAAIAACLLAVLVPSVSQAHGLAPAFLSLRETGTGQFEVTWKSAALRLPGTNVAPILPSRCRQTSSATAADDGERVTLHWTVDCGAAGLAGETIGVNDLATAKIDALLRIERTDGAT